MEKRRGGGFHPLVDPFFLSWGVDGFRCFGRFPRLVFRTFETFLDVLRYPK